MKYLILVFLTSFLVNILIIRFCSKNTKFCDSLEGVQKIHQRLVPRVGGISIYLSYLLVSLVFYFVNKNFANEFFLVSLCAFPLFFSGLLEDVTKKITPFWRLFAALISSALAYHFLSAKVVYLDISYIDTLLSIPLVSFLFTCFALAGVSHAFNIIDGFNGLTSGIAIIIFGAYAYLAFLLGDYFLLYLSLVMVSAILGFFVWNYPFGLIFLGDCGAYLIGYISALLGVLLINKHPEVSPWFPLLLNIYPIWETIFSIYRRKFIKDYSPTLPDAAHFHSLVYRRLLKVTFGNNISDNKRHALTSPYFWTLELVCIAPAISFWRNTTILMLSALLFTILYTWLYFRIVRFKTPEFLKRPAFFFHRNGHE